MKSTVIVLLFILSVSISLSVSRSQNESFLRKQFGDWMSKYQKVYSNTSETQKRFEIFKNNLKIIENFNKNKNNTWRMGINQFTDLSREEESCPCVTVDPAIHNFLATKYKYKKLRRDEYGGLEHPYIRPKRAYVNQASGILYNEVLDIQVLKNLEVSFHHATKDEVIIHHIRLPKQSTVGDVIKELKTKVELSHPDAELRLLEVFSHKISKIFPIHEKIDIINDKYRTLRAEEIPEDDKNLGPKDRLVRVYHFTKISAQTQKQGQYFGEPFLLAIKEGETLADIKLKVQQRLRVPKEELSKWKFAFLSFRRPDYLEDSDVLFNYFRRRAGYGDYEPYLRLEHPDKRPKRVYVNQFMGAAITKQV